MKVIKFEVEGMINSFRVPFFRSYHKSFLAPPKTTVIGMLCNISLKPQDVFYQILNENNIEVSVVINSIEGKIKDLWSYKTLKSGNRGTSIVRRDKHLLASYTIYLKIEDEVLFNEIFQNLNLPKNIPALGLDDELINITYVKEIILEKNSTSTIDSIFLNKSYNYKINVKQNKKRMELPTFHVTPIKFKAFTAKNIRQAREVVEEYPQVEFINCEIEFQDEVLTFIDNETNNRILFY